MLKNKHQEDSIDGKVSTTSFPGLFPQKLGGKSPGNEVEVSNNGLEAMIWSFGLQEGLNTCKTKAADHKTSLKWTVLFTVWKFCYFLNRIYRLFDQHFLEELFRCYNFCVPNRWATTRIHILENANILVTIFHEYDLCRSPNYQYAAFQPYCCRWASV